MSLTTTQLHVLHALFDLAQADRRANVRVIAEHLGIRLAAVADALHVLDEEQLVDARRVRLTFQGLTVSVASRALARERGYIPLAA